MPHIGALSDNDSLQQDDLLEFLQQLSKNQSYSDQEKVGLLMICISSGPKAVQNFLESYPDWFEYEYRHHQAQVLKLLIRERGQSYNIFTLWVAENLDKYDQQAHEMQVLLDDGSLNINAT